MYIFFVCVCVCRPVCVLYIYLYIWYILHLIMHNSRCRSPPSHTNIQPRVLFLQDFGLSCPHVRWLVPYGSQTRQFDGSPLGISGIVGGIHVPLPCLSTVRYPVAQHPESDTLPLHIRNCFRMSCSPYLMPFSSRFCTMAWFRVPGTTKCDATWNDNC